MWTMKRFALLVLCSSAAALPGTALGAGSSTHAGGALVSTQGFVATQGVVSSSGPRASLAGLVCQTNLDPAARAISVTATIRPLPGTLKQYLRFVLFERVQGSTSWTTVQDPGSKLGQWVLVPTETVSSPVANLAAPAAYRFEVSFKWTGAHGRLLGTATRESKVCQQPELRPDLTVDSIAIGVAPLHPHLDTFQAVIGDLGATGAGPFTVAVVYAHLGVLRTDDITVQHIGPHVIKTVGGAGPACDAGTPVTVTVDPQDLIDVYSRSQATLATTCPAPSSTS
jgi:hypothetical protein